MLAPSSGACVSQPTLSSGEVQYLSERSIFHSGSCTSILPVFPQMTGSTYLLPKQSDSPGCTHWSLGYRRLLPFPQGRCYIFAHRVLLSSHTVTLLWSYAGLYTTVTPCSLLEGWQLIQLLRNLKLSFLLPPISYPRTGHHISVSTDRSGSTAPV